MKKRLTIEQSSELIAAGISPSKASAITNYPDDLSLWTGRGALVFTLNDVVEITPKRIQVSGIGLFNLAILYPEDPTDNIMVLYCDRDMRAFSHFEARELIDAMFSALLWVLHNKYM